MGNMNLNLRPMNKGMVTNTPVNMLPPGAFLDLEGFIIKDGKLRLRPRFVEGKPYSYDRDTWGEVYDVIQYPEDASTITEFILTLTSVLLDTGAAYTAQSIAGDTTPFDYDSLIGIQHTLGRDSTGPAFWICDGANPIVKYNGSWSESTFVDEDSVARTDIETARSVLYHGNRLWIAGPTTAQGTMIRWSVLNNPEMFADTAYIYFPNRTQPIRKLMTLGQFLVIYFPDAVYIGQPSGDPYLPYNFFPVEMSNIGLLGPKAVTPWRNGHMFISQQGVYWLRPDRVVEEVMCPIWDQIKENITRTDKYTLITAGEHEDVYLGTPASSDSIAQIFYFNPVEGAWSYWYTNGDTLAISAPIATVVWSIGGADTTLPTGVIETWEDVGELTWADLGQFTNPLTVTLWRNGQLYAMSDASTRDDWAITGTRFTIETGDLDFEEADMLKTFHRLRIRSDIRNTPGHDVTVEGSIDGGRVWKSLGTFSLYNVDERWINFRLTGAECRLKLSGTADVLPYSWHDLTFRVRGRGLETL